MRWVVVYWLQLAKHPQADEPDLPLRFRKQRLARERNLPEYSRPVHKGELPRRYRRLLNLSVLGWRGEGDSPKILHVVLEELDSIGVDPLNCAHLQDDASRSFSATTVSYHDGGSNQQLAIQLDGSSMFVQVGCSGGHREGALLTILA